MSLDDLQQSIETPPSSTSGSNNTPASTLGLWEPDNIICGGINNTIINGRICSIINGSGNSIGSNGTDLATKRINGKYNTHIIGGTNISNVQDNAFYIGSDLKIDINEASWEVYPYKNVYASGDVIAYYTSDKRLKKNITNLSDDYTSKMKPVSFAWKNNGSNDIGLIAQQVKSVLPAVVHERKNNILGVQYHKLVVILIESIKIRQERINKLKKIINEIK